MSDREILSWLEAAADADVRQGMRRFGIPNERAFGVPVGEMRKAAKRFGPDQAAAERLWADGRYEARMMAVFIGEANVMTAAQADAWAGEFDNWAICDTACFSLFDKAAWRWAQVPLWAADEREFVRRAGFAQLWALSVHDKGAHDDAFEAGLALMPKAAGDPRDLVKKAIDMALRAVGKRNAALNASALATCAELEAMPQREAQWIGRHARRELGSDTVRARLGLAP